MKKRKFALVLSGGGFKGAFQVGALNYLKDNWNHIAPEAGPMHFDIIAGVSVGALNGAMMAMGKQDELNELWDQVAKNGVEEIYTSPFIDTKAGGEEPKFHFSADVLKEQFLPGLTIKANLWDGVKMLFSKKVRQQFIEKTLEDAAESIATHISTFQNVADNTPLYEKLQQIMDKDAITDCQYFCGFVSLDDGNYSSVASTDFIDNEDFINGVLASTAMPVVWKPVSDIRTADKHIRNSVDGGIRNNSPLGDVIRAIQDDPEKNVEYTIVIINCGTGAIKEKDFSRSNIFQIALRSLEEITLSEIFNNDIKHFMRINEIVCQAKAAGVEIYKDQNCPLRQFKTLIIEPAEGILGDMLCANETLISRRMKHGKQKAGLAVEAFVESEMVA
ncbi:MAG: patatin-like phospholipase family protein [Lewinellaceae bacterium]|nr:patatin-like phospholipase family protein [Lewinellaceae bacterium]